MTFIPDLSKQYLFQTNDGNYIGKDANGLVMGVTKSDASEFIFSNALLALPSQNAFYIGPFNTEMYIGIGQDGMSIVLGWDSSAVNLNVVGEQDYFTIRTAPNIDGIWPGEQLEAGPMAICKVNNSDLQFGSYLDNNVLTFSAIEV